MDLPSTKPQPKLQRLEGAAPSSGPDYEWKLGGLLSLRAYKNKLQFQLFSNVKAARPLDDLVLRLLGPSDLLPSAVTYFVQLKQSPPGGKQNPIGEQTFTYKDGDYSLYKYFQWYKKFCGWYNEPRDKLSDDEKLLSETPLEGIRLAIVTTKDVRQRQHTNGQPDSYEKDFPFEEIFSTTDDGSALSFNSLYSKVWELTHIDGGLKNFYREEFLGKLKIFCKQAYSDKLDEVIKQEIIYVFGEGAEKFLGPYLLFLKQWSENIDNNYCISNEVLSDFFGQQLRITTLGSICKNLEFKPESLECLRTILRSAKSVLNISVPGAAEPNLRAAKVLQSVKAEFGESSWLYVDTRILNGFNTEALITIADDVKVLITNVERQEDVTKVQNLLDAIRSKDISNEVLEVAVRTAAKGTTKNTTHVKDYFEDEWCMKDLTEEGQQVMLEREVVFQGKEMRLKNLKQTWTSMPEDVAADLLSFKREWTVGKRIEKSEDGMLPRRLTHYNMVSSRVLTEVDALNGGRLALGGFPRSLLEDVARSNGLLQFIKDEDVASVLKDNVRWYVIYYENEPSPIVSEEFLKKLVQDKAVNVIHWVEFVSGNSVHDLCMEWRMTHGNSVAIQTFIEPMIEDCSSKHSLCVHESGKSLEFLRNLDKVLLVGPAGQGKTTSLSCLASQLKQEESFEWIVNVKILEHRELLRKWNELEVLTLDHVVELLAAATGVEASSSSQRFLAAALKTRGVMSVIIDGLDEVAPVFMELTLRLLHLLLNDTNIRRVWVASRPQVAAPLRRLMQTPSLALQDLTQDEQTQFLNSRFSGEDETLCAEQVIQLLANTGNMLGIPLHLQMASDVYQEKWTQGMKNESHFSLFKLYDEFVKRKLRQYECRYSLLPEKSFSFYEKNEKLAVFHLYSDEPSAKDLPLCEFKQLMLNDDVLLQGKERTGIVWMEGHTLMYAHQTYAEYFAAKWLFRTAGSSREVRDFVCGMLKGEHVAKSRVQLFLEDQLSKEWPFHAAALRCNMKEVERLVKDGRWGLEHWDRRDTLLQWNFGEYVQHAFRDSVKLFPDESSFRDPWLVVTFKAAVDSGCASVAGEVMQRAKLPPSTLGSALRAAVDGGDIQVARVLLERGVKEINCGYMPILHLAVQRANFLMVDLLLNHSLDVNEKDVGEHTALHFALGVSTSTHQHEITQRLLEESSVDVSAENREGDSPLPYACAAECVSCAKTLLRRGAKVDGAAPLPLINAALTNNIEMLRFLLDEGASVNASKKNGETALHVAAWAGQMEAVQLFLLRGADINCRNIYGRTPLDAAKFRKEKEVVKILQNHTHFRKEIDEKSFLANLEPNELKKVAKNGLKDETLKILQGPTLSPSTLNAALRAAAEGETTGHTEVTSILLKHGANDSKKEMTETSLHCAAMGGNVATLELLLDIFNNFNVKDYRGSTPLHRAIGTINYSHRHDATQRLLREETVDVDAEDKREVAPLARACTIDCVTCVKALLQRGAKVDGINRLPILLSAMSNSLNSMRILLQNGAQVNARDRVGWTALDVASLVGEKEIVQLLAFEGADINLKTSDGKTALDMARQKEISNLLKELRTSKDTKRRLFKAAKNNNTSDLESLLNQGTIPNVRTKKQNTALHWVSWKGHKEALQLLLSRGASVYSVNSAGSSPLHYASSSGHTQVVEQLLQRGANVNSRDKKGNTPLLHAASEGHLETMELLLQHGAQVDSTDSEGNIPQQCYKEKAFEGIGTTAPI